MFGLKFNRLYEDGELNVSDGSRHSRYVIRIIDGMFVSNEIHRTYCVLTSRLLTVSSFFIDHSAF
jgi:hypothetical protein